MKPLRSQRAEGLTPAWLDTSRLDPRTLPHTDLLRCRHHGHHLELERRRGQDRQDAATGSSTPCAASASATAPAGFPAGAGNCRVALELHLKDHSTDALSVTPLQIARAYAAIGNGGISPDLRPGPRGEAAVLDEVAEQVMRMMQTVSRAPQRARRSWATVAGKTGTARRRRRRLTTSPFRRPGAGGRHASRWWWSTTPTLRGGIRRRWLVRAAVRAGHGRRAAADGRRRTTRAWLATQAAEEAGVPAPRAETAMPATGRSEPAIRSAPRRSRHPAGLASGLCRTAARPAGRRVRGVAFRPQPAFRRRRGRRRERDLFSRRYRKACPAAAGRDRVARPARAWAMADAFHGRPLADGHGRRHRHQRQDLDRCAAGAGPGLCCGARHHRTLDAGLPISADRVHHPLVLQVHELLAACGPARGGRDGGQLARRSTRAAWTACTSGRVFLSPATTSTTTATWRATARPRKGCSPGPACRPRWSNVVRRFRGRPTGRPRCRSAPARAAPRGGPRERVLDGTAWLHCTGRGTEGHCRCSAA